MEGGRSGGTGGILIGVQLNLNSRQYIIKATTYPKGLELETGSRSLVKDEVVGYEKKIIKN